MKFVHKFDDLGNPIDRDGNIISGENYRDIRSPEAKELNLSEEEYGNYVAQQQAEAQAADEADRVFDAGRMEDFVVYSDPGVDELSFGDNIGQFDSIIRNMHRDMLEDKDLLGAVDPFNETGNYVYGLESGLDQGIYQSEVSFDLHEGVYKFKSKIPRLKNVSAPSIKRDRDNRRKFVDELVEAQNQYYKYMGGRFFNKERANQAAKNMLDIRNTLNKLDREMTVDIAKFMLTQEGQDYFRNQKELDLFIEGGDHLKYRDLGEKDRKELINLSNKFLDTGEQSSAAGSVLAAMGSLFGLGFGFKEKLAVDSANRIINVLEGAYNKVLGGFTGDVNLPNVPNFFDIAVEAVNQNFGKEVAVVDSEGRPVLDQQGNVVYRDDDGDGVPDKVGIFDEVADIFGIGPSELFKGVEIDLNPFDGNKRRNMLEIIFDNATIGEDQYRDYIQNNFEGMSPSEKEKGIKRLFQMSKNLINDIGGIGQKFFGSALGQVIGDYLIPIKVEGVTLPPMAGRLGNMITELFDPESKQAIFDYLDRQGIDPNNVQPEDVSMVAGALKGFFESPPAEFVSNLFDQNYIGSPDSALFISGYDEKGNPIYDKVPEMLLREGNYSVIGDEQGNPVVELGPSPSGQVGSLTDEQISEIYNPPITETVAVQDQASADEAFETTTETDSSGAGIDVSEGLTTGASETSPIGDSITGVTEGTGSGAVVQDTGIVDTGVTETGEDGKGVEEVIEEVEDENIDGDGNIVNVDEEEVIDTNIDIGYEVAKQILGPEAAEAYRGTGLSGVLNLSAEYDKRAQESALNNQAALAEKQQGVADTLRNLAKSSDLKLIQDFGPEYQQALRSLEPEKVEALGAVQDIFQQRLSRATGDLSERDLAQARNEAFRRAETTGTYYDPIAQLDLLGELENVRVAREDLATASATDLANLAGTMPDVIGGLLAESPFTSGISQVQPAFTSTLAAELGLQEYANRQNLAVVNEARDIARDNYRMAEQRTQPSGFERGIDILGDITSGLGTLGRTITAGQKFYDKYLKPKPQEEAVIPQAPSFSLGTFGGSLGAGGGATSVDLVDSAFDPGIRVSGTEAPRVGVSSLFGDRYGFLGGT